MGIGSARLTRPQSLNLYAYVQNDPINAADPLGLEEDDAELELDGGGGGGGGSGDGGGDEEEEGGDSGGGGGDNPGGGGDSGGGDRGGEAAGGTEPPRFHGEEEITVIGHRPDRGHLGAGDVSGVAPELIGGAEGNGGRGAADNPEEPPKKDPCSTKAYPTDPINDHFVERANDLIRAAEADKLRREASTERP